MILVPTIPRTGTHFMRDHLLVGHAKHVDHIWPDNMDAWVDEISEGHPIIVPLRHPFEVAQSWKRRESGRNPLKVMDLPDWWRRLSGMIDPARPYYLPLDLPAERELALAKINCNLELKLRTDWPVLREEGVNFSVASGGLETEEYQVAVLDIMAELKPFFSRWYRVGSL